MTLPSSPARSGQPNSPRYSGQVRRSAFREVPFLNFFRGTSITRAAGSRKAQKRRNSVAAGLAFSMVSNESAQVVATGDGVNAKSGNSQK
jgi:hypothetical protein